MSKSTVIRKIDDLGRLVLPIDIRKKLNIQPRDNLEIVVEKDHLEIKKTSSLQNIVWLAQIILPILYEEYQIEATIRDENGILFNNKKSQINENIFPIVYDNKKVGDFIVYGNNLQEKQIIKFIILIFQKYLEEQL